MPRVKPPIFLDRALYRRRRLRDAARLVPVVGLFLLLLPLFWTVDSRVSLSSGDVLYFFGVWLFLIALAAAFAPGLREGEEPEEEED